MNDTVRVEFIVSDNDSMMRVNLRHATNHTIGKLLDTIPKPSFLVDPLHRIKVMAKEVFNLAIVSREKSDCEFIDASCLRKNIGCYIYKRDTYH